MSDSELSSTEEAIARSMAFRYMLVLALSIDIANAKTVYALTGNLNLAIEVLSTGILVAIPLLLAIYGRWISALGMVFAGLTNRREIIEFITDILELNGVDPNASREIAKVIAKRLKSKTSVSS